MLPMMPRRAEQPRRLAKRTEILRKAFELMSGRLGRLRVPHRSWRNGKSLTDARGEAVYAAEFLPLVCRGSRPDQRADGDRTQRGQHRISCNTSLSASRSSSRPWNFPAAMATRKIGPALAAGCSCILKPATGMPLTAYAMAALLVEAGVPAGVVNVVTTSNAGPIVDAMLHDPRVRKFSFTGSAEVGRLLLKQAADQIINCSMETGRQCPFRRLRRRRYRCRRRRAMGAGSGKLDGSDKWSFCLKAA